MRRASIRWALAGLAVGALGLPAAATAAPEVKVNAKIVPIPVNPSAAKSPNYPHTGDILGAGADVEFEATIKGTEYNGYPYPLEGVVTYLPKGATLHPQGFAQCPAAILESHEEFSTVASKKCPAKSDASPIGEARGFVPIGGEVVRETLQLQGYFTPAGLSFYAEGTKPTVIEVLSKGTLGSGASAGFGPKLTTEVPLVASLPGAPYASAEFIKIKVGAAYKKGRKLIPYGTVPKKCPKGGFVGKAEFMFGTEESEGQKGTPVGPTTETVPVTVTVPCPKASGGHKRGGHGRGRHGRRK